MSWSVSYIGTPTAITAALDAQSMRLTGLSKYEFDAVLPAMKTSLAANISSVPRMYRLNANGHATADTVQNPDGSYKIFESYFVMNLEQIHGQLV